MGWYNALLSLGLVGVMVGFALIIGYVLRWIGMSQEKARDAAETEGIGLRYVPLNDDSTVGYMEATNG